MLRLSEIWGFDPKEEREDTRRLLFPDSCISLGVLEQAAVDYEVLNEIQKEHLQGCNRCQLVAKVFSESKIDFQRQTKRSSGNFSIEDESDVSKMGLDSLAYAFSEKEPFWIDDNGILHLKAYVNGDKSFGLAPSESPFVRECELLFFIDGSVWETGIEFLPDELGYVDIIRPFRSLSDYFQISGMALPLSILQVRRRQSR